LVVSDGWLVDKSALARLATSPDAHEWVTRIQRGLVQVTSVTLLEVGYSARSAADWDDRVQAPPASLMPVATMTPAGERRALEVQGLLARQGHHRAPSVPELLIAAIAEVNDLTVLHVDKDFELIAEVTGQPVERLRLP
jgi:predicted nucleic acid-binding protein